MKFGPVGAELFHEDRQTDRQMDRRTDMMELIFTFSFKRKCPKPFFKNAVFWYFCQYYTLEHGRIVLHNL